MTSIRCRVAGCLTLACAVALSGGSASADILGSWSESSTPNLFEFQYRVTHLPDFDQVRAALPNCGRDYCVPTSSLNMLAYAANHGYPAVTPGPGNWQSDALYDQATTALAQVGAAMFTDPNDGTERDAWFFALAGVPFAYPLCQPYCDPLLPKSQFTVTAQFANGDYLPRMYKAAQTVIFNNGLLALCHGWYKDFGTCSDPNPPALYRDGGHCLTVQAVNGYWLKGGNQSMSNYGAAVLLRDPGADEGRSPGATCDAVNPFAQSAFGSNGYALGLKRITLDPISCLGSIYLDRLYFPSDSQVRLVDAYLIIATKAGFAVDPNKSVLYWFKPLTLGGAGSPPVTQVFDLPAGPVTAIRMDPDPSGFALIADNTVYRFDPLAGDLAPLAGVKLVDPADLVYGRRRQLYVISGPELVCIDIDAEPPHVAASNFPPSPCTKLAYDPGADEVVLLSPADGVIVRYPYHLDAIPVVLPIPGSVPMEGQMEMAVGLGGAIWLSSNATTSVYRLLPDPDGNLLATPFALPAVQTPPRSLDVDDAGNLFVNVEGAVHEFTINADGQILEVLDSPFEGLPGGSMFRVTRSSTNFDPAVHTFPAWRDVFPTQTAPPVPGCPADIAPVGGDGFVGVLDFLAVLAAWNTADENADVNSDGIVGILDFLEILAEWGPCPEFALPLTSDACGTASLVSEGTYAFDTTAAATDGPALPAECDEGSGLSLENDIWFLYVPSASGTAIVSTCGTANFDTRMAAYTGDCADLTLIACNDDFPDCPLFTSSMSFPVTQSVPVLIRLGGYGGASGTGDVFIAIP
jgi:hypothetical protein